MAQQSTEEVTAGKLLTNDEDLQEIWEEYQTDTQAEYKNETFRLDCSYCTERFSTPRERFQHEKTCAIGSVERFMCKLCCINFRYEQGLWRHQVRHQDPGGFMCQVCQAPFTSRIDRVNHIQSQHCQYKCQICVSTFWKKDDYVEHIIREHSNCRCWMKCVKEEDGVVEQTHPVETIDIAEYTMKPDEDLFNGIPDDPVKTKPIRRSCKRRKRLSSEKVLIPSDDEFPDIDDDMPLSQLKSQTTRNPRKITRKQDEEDNEQNRNSDASMGANDVHDSPSNDSFEPDVRITRRRRKSSNDEQKICKIPEYRCKFCPQIYCFEKRYLVHMKTEHGIDSNTEGAEDENLYSIKEAYLLGYRKHGCKFCKRRFASKEALKTHEKCHAPDGKLRIKCTLCNELFEDEQQIKEHKKSVHRDEVTCKFCNKTYAGERNLQTHIDLRHTKTKTIKKITYLCGKCGKNFTSKTAMMDHERSDCGKAPIYQCDVCKKFYHSAGSLKGHKSLHTKVKPFLCKFCGKSYRNPGQLRVHERTHTGEKPHKCTFCPKAFSHRETLLTHITMHTGFKRFMCSGCGKRFACISNLQVHRKAHADTCGLVPNCTKAVGPMDIHVMPQEEQM